MNTDYKAVLSNKLCTIYNSFGNLVAFFIMFQNMFHTFEVAYGIIYLNKLYTCSRQRQRASFHLWAFKGSNNISLVKSGGKESLETVHVNIYYSLVWTWNNTNVIRG